jgi:hypothetical protein
MVTTVTAPPTTSPASSSRDTEKKVWSRRTINILFTVFAFVTLSIAFVLTFRLNPIARQVPQLISGLGMLLAVIEIVIQARLAAKKVPEKEQAGSESKGVNWYFGLLFPAVYIGFLFLVGFLITTPLFLFLVPVVLGYRKMKMNIGFAIVTTAVLYYSFTHIFLLELPEGIVISRLLGR